MSFDTQLKNLAKLESTYLPNKEISKQLREKILVMVVGPPAIGKSSVMSAAVKLHSDFARVSGFTSRKRRPNDEPKLYSYITHDEVGLKPVIKKIERGELVQYAIHPTTHALYATRIEDYKSIYNLLDTLSSVVDSLRKLPFKSTITIGLVSDPETWQSWFLQRYPNKGPERHKRLQEAVLSLEWLLDQPDGSVLWLENKLGELNQTAQRLVNLCLGKSDPQPLNNKTKALAIECLSKVRTILGEDK